MTYVQQWNGQVRVMVFVKKLLHSPFKIPVSIPVPILVLTSPCKACLMKSSIFIFNVTLFFFSNYIPQTGDNCCLNCLYEPCHWRFSVHSHSMLIVMPVESDSAVWNKAGIPWGYCSSSIYSDILIQTSKGLDRLVRVSWFTDRR